MPPKSLFENSNGKEKINTPPPTKVNQRLAPCFIVFVSTLILITVAQTLLISLHWHGFPRQNKQKIARIKDLNHHLATLQKDLEMAQKDLEMANRDKHAAHVIALYWAEKEDACHKGAILALARAAEAIDNHTDATDAAEAALALAIAENSWREETHAKQIAFTENKLVNTENKLETVINNRNVATELHRNATEELTLIKVKLENAEAAVVGANNQVILVNEQLAQATLEKTIIMASHENATDEAEEEAATKLAQAELNAEKATEDLEHAKAELETTKTESSILVSTVDTLQTLLDHLQQKDCVYGTWSSCFFLLPDSEQPCPLNNATKIGERCVHECCIY